MRSNRIHDQSYIEEVCRVAGFPPPHFRNDVAHIKVALGATRGPLPLARLKALGKIPELSGQQFDTWCQPFGHTAIARFLNLNLSTHYQPADVWKWRKAKRSIPARIKALVARTPYPHDPEFPS